MANTVDKVLKIAADEVGYLEKSAAAYKKNPSVLDEKTRGAGSDNYTKYGRDMHKIYPTTMDFPAAWCDCFVDWCFEQAYGVSNAKKLLCGQFDDYTVNSANLYKNKKAWFDKPKVGDQIFFKNSAGGICHTGLVVKVSSTTVYTIEGNTSGGSTLEANGGGVALKSYPLNYARIAGYGRPKYDAAASSEKTTPAKETAKAATAPKVAKPTLKYGSTGIEVKHLQRDLKYLKFKGADGKELVDDSDFGNNTLYALKTFQKKYGLQVDGEYGPKSEAKMKEKLK